MILFILKSTFCLLILYTLYMIFMAKENAPVFKRYFLISGIVFSLAVPCMELNIQALPAGMRAPVMINDQLTEIQAAGLQIVLQKTARWELVKQIGIVLYLSVFLLLTARYIVNIKRLLEAGRNAGRLNGYKIKVVEGNTAPYSFLNTLYMNEKDYNHGKIEKEILIHEEIHIRQKHSLDILFIEFLQVIFWFNPLFLLFKKEIKLNHEYLADRGVVSTDVKISDYQNFMINSVFRNNSSYLASSFNYSFIKKRIIMLGTKKSCKRLFLKGTALFPFILLLAIAFAFSSKALAVDTGEWWESILKKHNLETTSYNNLGDVFEMGDSNSISDGVCRLTNAIVLIQDKTHGGYLLIRADRVEHNLKTGLLQVESGEFKSYATLNTDIHSPQTTGSGAMKINLNDLQK